jgi:hypothetical protein
MEPLSSGRLAVGPVGTTSDFSATRYLSPVILRNLTKKIEPRGDSNTEFPEDAENTERERVSRKDAEAQRERKKRRERSVKRDVGTLTAPSTLNT